MITKNKIIALTIALAVLFWLLDALIDILFFSDDSFLDELILHPSAYEIFIRLMATAFIVIPGIILSMAYTRRQKTEEKLKELYEQEMELRVQLEEERKRRIEFTRVLVHELKPPLTPIVAASELLAEELHEETLMRLAKSINQGALNLNNRIDELYDLMRGEKGTLQLEFEPVDLLPLLQNVANDMIPLASKHKHSITLDLPQSLSPIRADESRLQQIMLNLLSNAIKYTPNEGRITIRARENDTNLIVEVQDNGNGVAKEDQDRIFTSYYRVEGDSQHIGGLGLGLALCKTLVELHGGKIWVESSPGEGSTFGFSLPLSGLA